jgi:phosphohistidine phosphatase SixA
MVPKKISLFAITFVSLAAQAQNVGIGTTSPQAKLHVVDSSSNSAIHIHQKKSGHALYIRTDSAAVADTAAYSIEVESHNKYGGMFIHDVKGSWPSLYVIKEGPVGQAGYFTTNHPENANTTLLAYNNGLGGTGRFFSMNSNNTLPAVRISNQSKGATLDLQHSDTTSIRSALNINDYGKGTSLQITKNGTAGDALLINGNMKYRPPGMPGVSNLMLTGDNLGLVKWSVADAANVNGWSLSGNTGINANNQYIGTTDNNDVVLKSNNKERFRLTAAGDIGLGLNNPSSRLHVLDTFNNNTQSLQVEKRSVNGFAAQLYHNNTTSYGRTLDIVSNSSGEALHIAHNPTSNADISTMTIHSHSASRAMYVVSHGNLRPGAEFLKYGNSSAALAARIMNENNYDAAGEFSTLGRGNGVNIFLPNTSSTGAGLSVTHNGRGGAGRFITTNQISEESTLKAESSGGGPAASFTTSYIGKVTPSLVVTNTGGGMNTQLLHDNAASYGRTLDIVSNSSGEALHIAHNPTSNANISTMTIHSYSAGGAMYVLSHDNLSSGAVFNKLGNNGSAVIAGTYNATNPDPALYTFNQGTGVTALISNDNTSNSSGVLQIMNHGPGNSLILTGTGRGIGFNDGATERVKIGMYNSSTMGFKSPSQTNWGLMYDAVDNTIRIGTNQKANGYMVSVGGKIMAEEIRIQPKASWPDYVFENGYPLFPLSELESFIQKNKHLPGIPTANEVEQKGIEVGDMQKRMMEKIEELTLYIIHQQKEINELKKKVELNK